MAIERITEIGIAVEDLEQATRLFVDMLDATAEPVRFVEEVPFELRLEGVDFAGRPFDADVKITFAHPASFLGVLFEFIEYPAGYQAP